MQKNKFSYLCAVEIFLTTEDNKEVLLLKRGMHKKILPGYYAGIGGKMDSKNLESPVETVLRELKEEAGYKRKDLSSIQHKGLYTVKDQFGRWNVFEFIGTVKTKFFKIKKEIEEGCLEWVPINNLSKYRLIKDLRNGKLEKLLKSDTFQWVTVTYDKKDHITSIKDVDLAIF